LGENGGKVRAGGENGLEGAEQVVGEVSNGFNTGEGQRVKGVGSRDEKMMVKLIV
jgi:hypothetical protein